ncbi:MAG: site-2 protease family protein [Myxococcota bacterium]
MQLDPEVMRALPVWFTATLLSLTVHEAAHAWVGKLGGDNTAEDQVTLNPAPHAARQPFGMLLVPVASFLLYGGTWMIGFASAPYDPHWAMRFPKRSALMAAAGPLSNFLLAIIAGVVIHIGVGSGAWTPGTTALDSTVVLAGDGGSSAFTVFVSVLFSVNVLLGVFNLLPFAPLDGHAVVPLFLNERQTRKWLSFFDDRGAQIFGFMIALVLFTKVAFPVHRVALQLLYWPLS